MAKDLSGASARAASWDCSTSEVTQQQRVGGTSRAQVGRFRDGGEGGGGVVTGERCMALLLPKELSRRVFSQLDYRDLVQCSLVCKQWHSESTELRQGWKEELYWEACSIRGVHFSYNSIAGPDFPPLHSYLTGSPD